MPDKDINYNDWLKRNILSENEIFQDRVISFLENYLGFTIDESLPYGKYTQIRIYLQRRIDGLSDLVFPDNEKRILGKALDRWFGGVTGRNDIKKQATKSTSEDSVSIVENRPDPSTPASMRTGSSKSSRTNVYRLAYVLGLNNSIVVSDFFEHVFFSRAFELKNAEELIYYYQIESKKSENWFIDGQYMLKEYNQADVVSTNKDCSFFTGDIEKDREDIKDDKTFLEYLTERKAVLFKNKNEAYTARQMIRSLSDQISTMLLDRIADSPDTIFSALISDDTNSISKVKDISAQFRQYFPSKEILRHLYDNDSKADDISVEAISKMYRLLLFIRFFINQNNLGDEQVERFKDTINEELYQIYLPTLFDKNPFDRWLVHLAAFNNPIRALRYELMYLLNTDSENKNTRAQELYEKGLSIDSGVNINDWNRLISFIYDFKNVHNIFNLYLDLAIKDSGQALKSLVNSFYEIFVDLDRHLSIWDEDLIAYENDLTKKILTHWAFTQLIVLVNHIKADQILYALKALCFFRGSIDITTHGYCLSEIEKKGLDILSHYSIVERSGENYTIDNSLLSELDTSCILNNDDWLVLWTRLSSNRKSEKTISRIQSSFSYYLFVQGKDLRKIPEPECRNDIKPEDLDLSEEIVKSLITTYPIAAKYSPYDFIAGIKGINGRRFNPGNEFYKAFNEATTRDKYIRACSIVIHNSTNADIKTFAKNLMMNSRIREIRAMMNSSKAKFLLATTGREDLIRFKLINQLEIAAIRYDENKKSDNISYAKNGYYWKGYVLRAFENLLQDEIKRAQFFSDKQYAVMTKVMIYRKDNSKGTIEDFLNTYPEIEVKMAREMYRIYERSLSIPSKTRAKSGKGSYMSSKTFDPNRVSSEVQMFSSGFTFYDIESEEYLKKCSEYSLLEYNAIKNREDSISLKWDILKNVPIPNSKIQEIRF